VENKEDYPALSGIVAALSRHYLESSGNDNCDRQQRITIIRKSPDNPKKKINS
jgi:hypothetical protein